jgi:hypothetical protein
MAFVQTQRFLVGNVISQTFAAYFTRILPFSGFALIGFIPTIIFLGGYIYLLLEDPSIAGLSPTGDPADPFNLDELAALPWIWIIVASAGVFILSIATTAIWLAATAYGTFQHLRGQPVRFWQSLQRGVAVVLPCTGATFLIFLGALIVCAIAIIPVFMLVPDDSLQDSWVAAILWLIVGFFAIFIVFTIIGVRLWITVPAIAVEQPGVLAALWRSWNLTRGHTWRLFGVLLVMWLGTLAMSMVGGIAIGVMSVFGGVTGIFVGQGLNILISVIANALFAVAAAVVYVELRRAKEGFGLEDIAAIFD